MEQLRPSEKALEMMRDANHIYEVFEGPKYAIFLVVFVIEVILSFWLGIHLAG